MKNRRTEVVLEMMVSLWSKGSFKEGPIKEELSVSRSTFFRGLSDLRCYLAEHRPYVELIYDEEKGAYRLDNEL